MDYPLILTRTVTVAAVLFAVGCVIHVLQSRKRASNTVLWILVISYLPFVGPTLYLVFGINRVKRRIEQRLERQRRLSVGSGLLEAPPGTPTGEASQPAFTNGCPEVFREFFTMMDSLVDASAVGGNRCELMRGGERVYAAMAEAVTAAQTSIHLTTFILDHDQVGLALLDRMAERAAEGVEVRVLVDGYGTKLLPMSRVLSYRKRGVDLRVLHQLKPLSGRFAINLRNHRKILVIDGALGFTGGTNVSELHLAETPERTRSEDVHVAVRGPAVTQLSAVFAEDWHSSTGEALAEDLYFPRCAEQGTSVCRVLPSGPDGDYGAFHRLIVAAIHGAGLSLEIVTPYFIPSEAVSLALQVAAMRGVQVTVILPERLDHWFVGQASNSYLGPLLDAGVDIRKRPGAFVHAKVTVVDGLWALVGSSNVDPRGYWLNYELNLGIVGEEDVARISAWVETQRALAVPLDPKAWRMRGLGVQAFENFWALFSPLL